MSRFIEEQCNDTIDLRRKKKDQVVDLLKKRHYDIIDDDEDYRYLRSMPIDSVIEENIVKLRNERDVKKHELEVLKETTIENMWIDELDILEKQYRVYVEERTARQMGVSSKKKVVKKVKKMKLGKK